MAELLKNYINEKTISKLASELKAHCPDFASQKFKRAVIDQSWEGLELKDRIRKVASELNAHIPGSYEQKLKALEPVAPQFTGLRDLIFPEFVQTYGLHDWSRSLRALKAFTVYSTGEFAVRPFLLKDQDRMLEQMLKWSKDKNHHVRRLSSEGCRPRLPWSFKLRELIHDPKPLLPILENLKADPEIYVRKSVANNLNDISKDHPELVLKLAKKWLGKKPETDWILKHALRTLLKKGDQRALSLFGVGQVKQVKVEGLEFTQKAFEIGSYLEFSFKIENLQKKPQNLRLEYAIHYLKKGGAYSKKVFKLTERSFQPGQVLIVKRHSLKQMTTRVHYPGQHHLDIIVNGLPLATKSFEIV